MTSSRVVNAGRAVALVAVASTPIILFPWADDAVELPKRALGSVLLLLSALLGWKGGLKPRVSRPVVLAIFALLAASVISTLFSPWPLLSLVGKDYDYRGLLSLFILAGAAWIGSAYFSSESDRTTLAKVIVLSCAASALLGILGLWGIHMVDWSLGRASQSDALTWRAFGSLGNPSFFGMSLSICAPIAVGLVVQTSSWARAVWLFALLLILVAIVATGSRAGWLATIIALLLFLVSRKDTRNWRIAAFSIAVLVASALIIPIVTRTHPLDRLTGTALDSGSVLVRRRLAASAWELSMTRPITGYGIGTIPAVLPLDSHSNLLFDQRRNPSTHNLFIDSLLEGGVVLLLLTLASFGAVAWTCFIATRQSILASSFCAGLVALFIGMQFGFSSFVPAIIGACILGSLLQTIHAPRDFRIHPVFATLSFLPAAAVYATWLVADFMSQSAPSSPLPRSMVPWSSRLALIEAAEHQDSPKFAHEILVSACNWNPWNAELWMARARTAGTIGDEDDVESSLETATSLDRRWADPWIALAAAHRKGADYVAAEQAIQRALNLEPRNSEALNNLGNIRYSQRRFIEAIDAYESALEARPGWDVATRNLLKARRALEANAR